MAALCRGASGEDVEALHHSTLAFTWTQTVNLQ